MTRRSWVVSVPARNEEEHVGGCLQALAEQQDAGPGDVVVLVNNSSDRTAEMARSVRFPSSIKLHVVEAVLPPEAANAGNARRLAMTHAAAIAGASGVLLTTDADGLVDPDWVAANLACIAAGADAVAGWVELFPSDWSAIPARLHEDDARECAYDALCDEIEALVDPDPADPVPRHTQNSGASIAVTAEAYRRCGGVPAVVCGEDRALIAALRRVDARVRHAPEVHVQVSGRITGRCEGGMADTIRRRLTAPDAYVDDRLEPAVQCALRASLRAALRGAYGAGVPVDDAMAQRLGMSTADLAGSLRLPYFGMAWNEVEAASPKLRRVRVSVADLGQETASAKAVLSGLKGAGISDDAGLVPYV